MASPSGQAMRLPRSEVSWMISCRWHETGARFAWASAHQQAKGDEGAARHDQRAGEINRSQSPAHIREKNEAANWLPEASPEAKSLSPRSRCTGIGIARPMT